MSEEPRRQQAERQHTGDDHHALNRGILLPGKTAKAKQHPFTPMAKRFICAEVEEVEEVPGTPPAQVWAALIALGNPIPLNPPGSDPAGLQRTQGLASGSLYQWKNTPSTANNPGEMIHTTLPSGGNGPFWFVVWFRRDAGSGTFETYYIETRKVTISHDAVTNKSDCDPP